MTLVEKFMTMDPDDVARMTNAELKEGIHVLSRKFKAGFHRLEQMPDGIGTSAPAYRKWQNEGFPSFSVKGIKGKGATGKLQHLFSKARQYAGLKTNSVGGFQKMRENTFGEDFKKKGTYYGGSPEAESDFWKLFDACKMKSIEYRIPSLTYREIVKKVDSMNLSFGEKIAEVERRIEKDYNATQDTFNENKGGEWYDYEEYPDDPFMYE